MPLVKTIYQFFLPSKRTCFLFRREPLPAAAAGVVVVVIKVKDEVPVHTMPAYRELEV
jgi:hypothetical protein